MFGAMVHVPFGVKNQAVGVSPNQRLQASAAVAAEIAPTSKNG